MITFLNETCSMARKIVADIMGCELECVRDVEPLKAGMTNDSFVFGIDGHSEKYIIRVPGRGTDMLINRNQEYDVYQKIIPLGLSDEVVHIDPKRGYKITKFWESARTCYPYNHADLTACMNKLRSFHRSGLVVQHEFCPFERIEFYERLWGGKASAYADYKAVKTSVLALAGYVADQPKDYTLTHVDAVPDNFIFLPGGELRLIDWEYAAMQDPHLDIAMFIVYAMYDRKDAETLIDLYFAEGCGRGVRRKIYAYVAVCGLLWSNWCEYKKTLGEEFGVYALRQYEFAKEYSRVFAQS